jgi:tRNA-(ms[2]io[6]A)-hydroxylase
VLNLATDTDASWLPRVLNDLDALLIDHAHCEKKAAGAAIQMLFRYPQHAFLHAPLSQLAREELLHFEAVLEQLTQRGVAFGRQRASAYAGKLHRCLRTHEPARLIDSLLCCALIEARSCERFRLLSEGVGDPQLAALYTSLLASEARHHQVYVELARELAPEDEVRSRLAELAQGEAAILAENLPMARMHG